MTKIEEKKLEIYQAELQRRARIENNDALLSYEDIAILTGYADNTVKNDLTKRPGFPSPIMGKKYKCSHVKQYINQVARQSLTR